MFMKNWLDLQMFAEGGDGAGTAATGETPAAAGQDTGVNVAADAGQRLLELGVPRDKIRKREKRAAALRKAGADVTPLPSEASEGNGEPKAERRTNSRLSWEDILKDPEYNQRMQETVKASVRRYKEADEKLAKLAPALEQIAQQKGMDRESLDYDALAKVMMESAGHNGGWGIREGQAGGLTQQEQDAEQHKAEQDQARKQQLFTAHIQELERQGAALKNVFKSFDLHREMQNPVFARLTSPGVGMNVEDAYYAVHRKQLQAASSQVIAQNAAKKLSNAIASGRYRPIENGTVGAAPAITAFDYRNASKDQREALKKRIKDAAARGQKIYPGRI